MLATCLLASALMSFAMQVNQLHLELVRRKDVMDAEVKKVKSMLRKIEHENADLRFLNTQYAHKVTLTFQYAIVDLPKSCNLPT